MSRLLPNEGDLTQWRRQLLIAVVYSKLLYTALVWSEALCYENKANKILRPQRRIALKIAFAYRTVSILEILVADSVQPIHMLSPERNQI